MNEWTIVTVLATIVGLGVTVGGPLIKLNTAITTLTVTLGEIKTKVNQNETAIEEHKRDDHESHKRIWVHETKQDKQLARHETRIKVLEKKEGVNTSIKYDEDEDGEEV